MKNLFFKNPRARQVAKALTLLLHPSFLFYFNVPDYLASPKRPRGWWAWFPRLHYCMFNVSLNHGGKAEDGGIIEKLDPAKKTILFVSHEASRSGAPILLLNLMNQFREEHNVALVCVEGGGLLGNFRDMASFFMPPRPGFNSSRVFKREIGRLLKRTEVAFAIVNTLDASEALRFLCKRGVPSIHLVHEFPVHPAGRWGLKVSTLYADAMVFSSQLLLRDAVRKHLPLANSKALVIPQGIFHPSCETSASDCTESSGDIRALLRGAFPNDGLLIIGGGTVDYRKGVDLFLSCARKVIELLPGLPIRFAWIGSGFHGQSSKPYAAFVREEVEKHGLGEAFMALDEVLDFREVCRAADIFLLPSRLDPLPVVAQTAMDCGLPLLCFREATGITEFLETDQDASFGICPYMNVQAMAGKLAELLTDPGLRRRVGKGCERVAATQFSASAYVTQLKELSLEVQKSKENEREDAQVIAATGGIDSSFTFASKRGPYNDPITDYLRYWRGGIHKRKPKPGIHPGIYEEKHGGRDRDPFAEFLREGAPVGDWSLPVISPKGKRKRKSAPHASAALHLHLYYHGSARALFSRITRSAIKPDLFISVPSEEALQDVSSLLGEFRFNHVIRVVPNRGRDIGPLFTEFSEELQCYEFIGHAHSKETHHVTERWYVEQWTEFLFENVLGGRHPMIDLVLEEFLSNDRMGLVFPDDPHVIGWTQNFPFAEDLAVKMGILQPLPKNINFPVGTMFWARSKALKPLFDLNLQWDDYPEEPIPIDGSMLHAIERLLPLVVDKEGYSQAVTHVPGVSR